MELQELADRLMAHQLGPPEDLELSPTVNDQLVVDRATLAYGDRLLLIPPVAGGRPSSV